jgi:predicted nucleic acid-binding protein
VDDSPIRISDTGPLLHLHWVGASEWALPPEPVLVVETVAEEVRSFDPHALDYPQVKCVPDVPPSQEPWTGRLDDGEVAALSLAVTYQSSYPVTFMCDDRDARRTATALGLPVIGSIGLLLAAHRSGRIERLTTEEAIRALRTKGQMRVSERLLQEALAALDDEDIP